MIDDEMRLFLAPDLLSLLSAEGSGDGRKQREYWPFLTAGHYRDADLRFSQDVP